MTEKVVLLSMTRVIMGVGSEQLHIIYIEFSFVGIINSNTFFVLDFRCVPE